jgi:hypothetical protein
MEPAWLAVSDGLSVLLSVRAAEGDCVCVRDGAEEAVTLAVPVEVSVPLGVRAAEGDAVCVHDGVAEPD